MIRLISTGAVHFGLGHEAVDAKVLNYFPGTPNIIRRSVHFVAKFLMPSRGGPAPAFNEEVKIVEDLNNNRQLIEVSRRDRKMWDTAHFNWSNSLKFSFLTGKVALSYHLAMATLSWFLGLDYKVTKSSILRRIIWSYFIGINFFRFVKWFADMFISYHRIPSKTAQLETAKFVVEQLPAPVQEYRFSDQNMLPKCIMTAEELELATKVLVPVYKVHVPGDQYDEKSINKLPTALVAARDRTRAADLYLFRLYSTDEYHPYYLNYNIAKWECSLTSTCTMLLVDKEALAELLDPSISGPYYTESQVHDNMTRAISGRLDRIDTSRFNNLHGFRHDHDTVVAAMFIWRMSHLPSAISVKPGKEEAPLL